MNPPNGDVIVELIEALADADGVEPSAVDFTLSDYMDPEVLVKLDSMDAKTWELTFRVSDHQARITHDGVLFIDGVRYSPGAPQHE